MLSVKKKKKKGFPGKGGVFFPKNQRFRGKKGFSGFVDQETSVL